MTLKNMLHIPVIVQSLAEIILLLTSTLIIFSLVHEWNFYRHSFTEKNFSTEISLEITRILRKTDSEISEEQYETGKLSYIRLENADNGTEIQKSSTAGKSDVLSIEEHFSRNRQYPSVICNKRCYILNYRSGVNKTGIPIKISYAVPFEHAIQDLKKRYPVDSLFILIYKSPESDQLPENIEALTKESRIYPNGGKQLKYSEQQNKKANSEDLPVLNDIMKKAAGEKTENFILKNAEKTLSSPDLYYAAFSSTQTKLQYFLIQNRIMIFLALLAFSGFALLFLRRIRAVGDSVKIIRRNLEFCPSFIIRDEVNFIKIKLAELIKTCRQQKNTISHLREILSRYSDLDPVTGLPLKRLFCRNAADRIISSNPACCSSLALISINCSKQANASDDFSSRMADAVKTIEELLDDRDCLGCDTDIGLSVFLSDRKNMQENVAILQNFTDIIRSRCRSGDLNAQIKVHCGVVRLESSSDTVADLYFRAQLSLFDAMRRQSFEPVLFDRSMISDHSPDMPYTDNGFENDFENGKIYTIFLPVLKTAKKKCTSMLCQPRWRIADDEILTGYEIYNHLESRGSHRQILHMILEDSFRMIRKIDTAGNGYYNEVIIILTQEQINDAKLFEFIEVLTQKYTMMNSRIVFGLNREYLLSSEYDTGKIIQKLGEMDFSLILVCPDDTEHVQELLRKYSFKYLAVSCGLALEIIQDPVKLDDFSKLQQAVESTGRKICIYNVETEAVAENIIQQIRPDFITGNAIHPAEDDDPQEIYSIHNR